MTEKFTKGEWYAKQDNGNWYQDENYTLDCDYGCLSFVMVGCEDQAVAIIPDYDGDESQLDANAHLIAAAPEMYRMLKACSGILNQVELWHTAKEIDDLLAKARGED